MVRQIVAARRPTEELTGQQLRLRPYRESDRPAFIALVTDPEVMRHVGGAMPPEAAGELFDAHIGVGPGRPRLFAGWAAERTADGTYLGSGSLLRNRDEEALEIGYLLLPAHWGRGYATTIAGLLLGHAHRVLGHSRVVATVDTDHPPSIRVLEKVGMRLARRASDDDGEYLLFESVTGSPTVK